MKLPPNCRQNPGLMATTKKSSAGGRSSKTDQRTQWLKAVQGLERNVGKLLDQLDGLKELTSEGLEQIENERLAAKTTLDAELLELDARRKREMLTLELDLERTRRDGAIETLAKTGEEPILAVTHQQLRDRVAALEQGNEAAVKAAEDTLRKSLTMAHRMELERTKLTNEKEMAELTQKNLALISQIEDKNAIIGQQREDNIRLQGLVQGVAEASKPTINYPSNSK